MIILVLVIVGGGVFAGILLARSRVRRRSAENQILRLENEIENLQTSFSRFVPPEVVDRLIDQGTAMPAERKSVTVLFADIEGFTRLSETLPPETIVTILNGYFEKMTTAITAHQGHVGKFIGDGLLATFGALSNNPWQVRDAVDAARAMRTGLREYNRDLTAQGLPTISFGIGIHCGPLVVGLIGGRDTLEYTVIGDVVNTASRVEGLTRRHRVEILVTAPVYETARDTCDFSPMPPSRVRGKAETIATWAVV